MQKRMISRLKRKNKPAIKPKIFTLKNFWENRDKILIIRAVGGLGDILMHRMIFEDFKRILPTAEIHFACPRRYHAAVDDHPFIDVLLDSDQLDKSDLIDAIVNKDSHKEKELRSHGSFLRQDYIISYNTTTICGRSEVGWAPFSKLHRSDIWANHCGVELTKHNMYLKPDLEHKQKAKELIEKHRTNSGPAIAFCPISAMVGKNLEGGQITETVKGLQKMGFYVYGVHNGAIPELEKMNVPILCQTSLKTWISIIDQSDYILGVDSAAIHCAGGLGKPMVGVFSWADGEVYLKYYENKVLVQKHRNTDPTWTCGPCYNWGCCTMQKHGHRKPCITEMTPAMILQGVTKMVEKYPPVSAR